MAIASWHEAPAGGAQAGGAQAEDAAHGGAAAAAAAAATEPVAPQGFVPLRELTPEAEGSGAAGAAPYEADPYGADLYAAPYGAEPAAPRLESSMAEAAPEGYESGDDMDYLSTQHCTNCTGPLWGHVCMECGHMPAHDSDIFAPSAGPARPRLGGDALAVLCWDERMELHEEGGAAPHPERPDRVRAIMARLHAAQLTGRCTRLPSREATRAELEAAHIPELVDVVAALSDASSLAGGAPVHFSPDTYANEHTALCARLSAGACVDVATAVARREAAAGVAICRPPGHHAESNTAMGFCFYNNAAVAARAAQAAGAGRVLILDWDVHHGNGTQHIFEGDGSVLYMSLHRHDGGEFYPGTGAAAEVGRGDGEGATVNVAWPCGGMRDADYLAAMAHVLLPVAYEFAPDLVIISAGFDAAEGDPIGGCHVSAPCFAAMAAQLQLVAPTVALLEGGYNLLATASATEACVRVLLGERPPRLPAPGAGASRAALAAISATLRCAAPYWHCLAGLAARLAPPTLLAGGGGAAGEEEGGLDEAGARCGEAGADTDTPRQAEFGEGSGWESDVEGGGGGEPRSARAWRPWSQAEAEAQALAAAQQRTPSRQGAPDSAPRSAARAATDSDAGSRSTSGSASASARSGGGGASGDEGPAAAAIEAASPDLVPALGHCAALATPTDPAPGSPREPLAGSGGGQSHSWSEGGAAAQGSKRAGQAKAARLSPQLVGEQNRELNCDG